MKHGTVRDRCNLYRDGRGIYIWRRVHEITGKRVKRSTGRRQLRFALLKAREFEEEYQRQLAGISKYENYRLPVDKFLSDFLESINSERQRKLLGMQLSRAFDRLGLKRLADLENFLTLDSRMHELQKTASLTLTTLRRCYQEPLKQYSKFLASRRITSVDHLGSWRNYRREDTGSHRKALDPDLFVRALAASDCLDRICQREWPTRPVWTALLIAAARFSAFAALDIKDLDREKSRFLLVGHGNKHAGAAALDDTTLKEVIAYIGARHDGPLFLSPHGSRLLKERSLDYWRDAVSMAAVDIAWPAGVRRDLSLVYRVHLALRTGRPQVAMGGQALGVRRPGMAKQKARNELLAVVTKITDQVRERWHEQMNGVDQHCLRTTHRTWAVISEVPEILIDRQLGHSSAAAEAALNAAWSVVGRKHYTDMSFLTGDARRSAIAVRKLLDAAQAEFTRTLALGESALIPPQDCGRPGVVDGHELSAKSA